MITKFKLFENKHTYNDIENLFKSIKENDIETLMDYINNGGDINIIDWNDKSLLNQAIDQKKYKIMRYLIKNGIDINSHDGFSYTPLMTASRNNNLIAIEILIEAGADWNILDRYGADFLDHLHHKTKEMIFDKYPEQYQKYLGKKKSKDFNL